MKKLSNLEHTSLWKGNRFLNAETSNSLVLGTLKMNYINNGDAICIFFLDPNGTIGTLALSTIYKNRTYFSVIVSIYPKIIFTIKFKFDQNGNFYCEEFKNSSNNSNGIHIMEICKFSSKILSFN